MIQLEASFLFYGVALLLFHIPVLVLQEMTLSGRADEDEDFEGMCEVVISVKMKMELKSSFVYNSDNLENYGKLA